jgi:hypothetical protein
MSGRFRLEDYVSVQERIVQFWKDHPNGRILTALVSDPANWDICRYRAEVYTAREDERPVATGYAFEIAGKGMANQTSHEENAETSAIGRALANLGYATSQKDRPSREEMGKVERTPQARQDASRATAAPQTAPSASEPAEEPLVSEEATKALAALAIQHKIPWGRIDGESMRRWGNSPAGLRVSQARELYRWVRDLELDPEGTL